MVPVFGSRSEPSAPGDPPVLQAPEDLVRPFRQILDFDHTLRVSGSIRIAAEALEDAAKRSSGRLMTEPFPNICPQCLVLLSHLRGGLTACARSCGFNQLYGSAPVDYVGEGERVPVGKRMQPCDSVLLTFCGCGVP